MCGIVGAIDIHSNDLLDKVNLANELLSHRGPDGTGIESFRYEDINLVFAHSRLSIIDLSDSGHQPMSSKNERYWITFNGEIYNYKELKKDLQDLGYVFTSGSDTEVLLNCWIQWGSGCLTRLIGMFAFAIFDLETGRVFLVRDAFGIKPLYYYSTEERFYFSSEVPSLLKLIGEGVSLNSGTVINYLKDSTYDVAENTFTDEVLSLKPGCFLEIDLDRNLLPKQNKWWNPSLTENTSISFSEAAERLRHLFLDSVRLHLRSDVAIGAALSGGIDSSAIVCAMRHLEPEIPIHTFSYIASDTNANEEKWVDIVNHHVGAISHKVSLNKQDLLVDLEALVRAQGEPFGSTSIFAQYRVFKLARDTGVTVVLEGQGADELLAGYFGYPEYAAMSYVDRGQFLALFRFISSWSNMHKQDSKAIWKYVSMLFISGKIKKYLGVSNNRTLRAQAKKSTGANSIFNLLKYASSSKEPAAPSWLIDDDNRLLTQALAQSDLRTEERPVQGRRLVHELRRSLMGHHRAGVSSLLRHGDRNSMKWSVESRVPFLTTEIAEFLFTLPEKYLLSDKGQTKYVFRKAMRGIVPDEILDRIDKVGFETPEKDWASSLDVDKISEVLSAITFLDEKEIENEFRDTINGSIPFSWFPWRAANLSKWLELNKEFVKN